MAFPLKKSPLANNLILFFSGWGVLAILLAWAGLFYGWVFAVYAGVFISFKAQGRKKGTGYSTQGAREEQGARRKAQENPISKFSIPNSTPVPTSHFQILTSKFKTPFFCSLSPVTRNLLPSPVSRHLLLLFVLSFFLASFLSPATFFSGRDEGSIFQASHNLATHHTLTASSPESRTFFEIYGKGQALNFPGFYYTGDGALITQFPVAAIAWYASFLSLFGLFGLIVANGILLFLFSLALTLIIKSFATPKWTLLGIALLFTSFPIFWFSRFTLSENFFLAFLWIFVWITFILAEKPTPKKLFLFFLLGILLVFGRIEGIAFLAMAIFFLLYRKKTRVFLTQKYLARLLLPAGILLLLGSLSLAINTPFYITIAKGFLNGSQEVFYHSENIFTSFINRLQILFLYGLGLPLLLGSVGIMFFLRKKILSLPSIQNQPPCQQTATPPLEGNNPENSPLWRGAESSRRGGFPNNTRPNILLLSLWITLPSLLYLFISFISPDHPWMLRRFLFSITPLFLFFSLAFCFFLESKNRRFFSYTLFTLLLLSNAFPLFSFFPLVSGGDLLKTTTQISQTVPENELLLVDQLSSGDGFHMLAGPLQTIFNRHAVYFMNPSDLEKLNTKDFSSLSLLVSEDRAYLYTPLLQKHNAHLVETFPVTFSTLEKTSLETLTFPKKITLTQTVRLYRWTIEVQ